MNGAVVASIRKRTWRSAGETKTAWIADYFDQGGKRRLKTFPTKKAADAWLVTARGEVATTARLRARLLEEAASQERLAREVSAGQTGFVPQAR